MSDIHHIISITRHIGTKVQQSPIMYMCICYYNSVNLCKYSYINYKLRNFYKNHFENKFYLCFLNSSKQVSGCSFDLIEKRGIIFAA